MGTTNVNGRLLDGAPVLVDASGRPARRAADTACPRCSALAEKRVASGGFGVPHPICSVCGHEWLDEVWRG